MKRGLCCFCLILVLSWFENPALGQKEPATDYHQQMEAAAELVNSVPRAAVQHDYVVTAAVRILLFWVSRDDVGQGYIRIGTHPDDPATEIIQLLMGSDPAKAPLGINNWGAATEVWRRSDGSAAFFGFMKAPKDDSMGGARQEVSREKENQRFQYQGIISRVSDGRLISVTVPISSSTDFTLHQLPLTRQMVLEQLKTTTRPPRILEAGSADGCAGGNGFLFTVRELMTAARTGQKTPITRCYSYLSGRYTMALRGLESLPEMKIALKMRGANSKVERTYRNLRKADFRIVNLTNGNLTDFKMVFGDSGDLKGIPVQIEYQPNWWIRITISLKPGEKPIARQP